MRTDEEGQSPRFLAVTVARATELTGLGRSTLFELLRDGELERIKIGKRTLIPHGSLVQFLDRHRVRDRQD